LAEKVHGKKKDSGVKEQIKRANPSTNPNEKNIHRGSPHANVQQGRGAREIKRVFGEKKGTLCLRQERDVPRNEKKGKKGPAGKRKILGCENVNV